MSVFKIREFCLRPGCSLDRKAPLSLYSTIAAFLGLIRSDLEGRQTVFTAKLEGTFWD
jgi:hypothetical protein